MSDNTEPYAALRAALDAVEAAHAGVAAGLEGFKQAVRELAVLATKAACDFPDSAALQYIAEAAVGESDHLRWTRLPGGVAEDLVNAIRGDDSDDDDDDPAGDQPSGPRETANAPA